MEISITKKDVIWGYLAQFFSIASGIIVLPLILRMLSAEEIGMNYLMLSIGAMVTLFDFGFSPQFSRNITYIFSGAQELKIEGFVEYCAGTEINNRLLSTMIATAKFIYRMLAIGVLIIMLTLGSLYIYKITNGFTNIKNSFLIWLVYSISVFFILFYSYYSALLIGKGLIMDSRKAIIFSKLAYIILSYLFLIFGLGLLGVVLANLISPFINRIISHYYFFTKEMKYIINSFNISKKEKIDLLYIIWYNAKKLGLVFISTYAIRQAGLFFAGLFFSLEDIASYGLMLQLGGLIVVISSTFFNVYQTKFASLRIKNDRIKLFKEFAFTMNIYYILFILGFFCLMIVAPFLLFFINSNITLPVNYIMILYLLVVFLEGNHSCFGSFIASRNNIPFVKPALISGGAIIIGSYISLKYTTLGILGLVLVQGICQLVYNNWWWTYIVCKEFNKNIFSFVCLGFNEVCKKISSQIKNS